MLWLRIVWVVAALSAFTLHGSLAAEPRLALLMGVGNYAGTKFQTLPGINKDLKRMEAALVATGFQVTVVSDPTLTAAEDAIETFGARLKSQAGGVGLFYFSGHGGEIDGRNYLIPKGARIGSQRDIKEQAVAAQRVLNRMEDAGARVNIVFLDCCRNDLTKASTDSGLAPMSAKGTFIGFATAADRTSAASNDGSPYTTILSKRILTPGISILDMHTQVTADVEDFTKANGSEQTPFQYSGLRSSFFFVPSSPQTEMAKLTPSSPVPSSSLVRPSGTPPVVPQAVTRREVAVLKTSAGEMVIEFWPDVAPKTVANFLALAKQGFYDGTAFHRIIDGFMIQGGDPLTKDPSKESMYGTGASSERVKAEFNERKHELGVISMARSMDPNSASCQFFICLGPTPLLDGKYTAFGKLIKGEAVLQKIGKTPVEPSASGEPSKPLGRVGLESVRIVPADSVK